MPVERFCSRHATLSVGRCPQCRADRKERRCVHVSAARKKFRRAILERDGHVCHWCGGEATSIDYLRALVDGGKAFDESNAVASCLTCNFRRGAAITNGGGFSCKGRQPATARGARSLGESGRAREAALSRTYVRTVR